MSKGFKHSDEVRRKMSESHIGHKGYWLGKKRPHLHDEEQKRKWSLERAGVTRGKYKERTNPSKRQSVIKPCIFCHMDFSSHPSFKQKLCSNECRSSYIRTPEFRIKQSLRQQGEKGNNWKGGITRTSDVIRRSAEYRLWRESVFKRDDYTCQACGNTGGNLIADHELPFAFYPDLRFEILNGRTLCNPCHENTPTYKNHHNNIYG